ncbi:hypothetical protein CHS0354_033208 [Potamilus streckersoni]|uniref:Uncharacterized protein n=1 Tax=Potamilus streckersoni TaxID=2493646 RepID=A0AAE0S658_9BIVA|nr:hypothetical protein CHS0354_033208 [Potamilus streckersoni]
MASRMSKWLLRPLKGRAYATQTGTQVRTDSKPLIPSQGAKITQLPNGILVASLENYSPITRIAAVTLAGSRCETPQDIGITHCIRVLAGLSTKRVSSFGLTRSVMQMGGSFSCTTSREFMQYTIQCQRDNVQEALEPLVNIMTKPAFKPWEVRDIQPHMEVDLAILKAQPENHLMELVHEAAFRDTLGQSLYAPAFKIGKYNPEQLMSFVHNQYTAGRIAVVGVGVDHDFLTHKLMRLKFFDASHVETKKAVFHGGELRVSTPVDLTYVAVATEGPSLNSKEYLAAGVLQMILGSGPFLKYSSNITCSKLARAVSKVTDQPFAISGLNASYSDSGLFGFVAISQPEDMEKVLRGAFKEMAGLSKTGVSDEEVQRGKNQLKSSILMSLEDGNNLLTDLVGQSLLYKKFVSPEELSRNIDDISKNDINNVAKKIVTGKPAMAAVGDLSNTPYLDELRK